MFYAYAKWLFKLKINQKGEKIKMKKKIVLIVVMIAILACLFAISVCAASYDFTRKVTLDNNTEVALYDSEGNALTWYYDGTNLVSAKTADVISVNGSGWITYQSTVTAANVVVANFQDPDYSSKITNKVSGLNISYRHSTNLEYVFLADEIKQFNGTYLFSNCDKMKVFEITENSQITSFSQYMFYDCAVLKEFYIPAGVTAIPTSNSGTIGFLSMCPLLEKVTFAEGIELNSIGDTAFYGNTSLTSIDLPDGLEKILSNAFNSCTNLKDVEIPDSVTTLGENAFRSTGIVNSPFTANSRCTTWGKYVFRNCDSLKNFIVPLSLTATPGDQGHGPFAECAGIDIVTFGTYGEMTTLPTLIFALTNIKEVVLPDGLVTIEERAFHSNTGIKEIILPNTVEIIGERAFQGCSSLEKIVFGNSFKYITNTGTDHNSLTYGAPLKQVYLPASFYAEAPETDYKVSYAFQGTSGNTIYFYTGTKDQLDNALTNFKACAGSTDNNGNFLNATQVSYSEYIQNISAYESGKYIVYGLNACDAFYDGVHLEDNNACVINCSQCQTYGAAEENPVHNEAIVISYANGYHNVGAKITSCTNEGCAHSTTEETAALFTCLGYSAPMDGRGGIAIGFTVNNEAIAEYEEITGKTLKYGVFAVLQSRLGDNDVFAQDGTVADGVIDADITSYELALFELKIVGFADNQKDIKLAMGAYVAVTDGEATEYSYMQSGTPVENEKYCFVSYNDIVGSAEEVTQ